MDDEPDSLICEKGLAEAIACGAELLPWAFRQFQQFFQLLDMFLKFALKALRVFDFALKQNYVFRYSSPGAHSSQKLPESPGEVNYKNFICWAFSFKELLIGQQSNLPLVLGPRQHPYFPDLFLRTFQARVRKKPCV